MMWTQLDVARLGTQAHAYGAGFGFGLDQLPRNCASLTLVGRRLYLLGGHEGEPAAEAGGAGGAGSAGSAGGAGAGAGASASASELASASAPSPASSLAASSSSSFAPAVLDVDRSAWLRPPTRSAA